MTAPAITTAAPVIIPATPVQEAHAVLHEALNMPWPNREACKAIGNAALDLDKALDTHQDAREIAEALTDGSLHWEMYDEDLWDRTDPQQEAAVKAAEDTVVAIERVDAAARALVRAISEHTDYGDVAAQLSGRTGEK